VRLAADRKDGSGLQLENNRLMFSSFSFGFWKIRQQLWFVLPLKNHSIPFF